jgi:hypothetical protein
LLRFERAIAPSLRRAPSKPVKREPSRRSRRWRGILRAAPLIVEALVSDAPWRPVPLRRDARRSRSGRYSIKSRTSPGLPSSHSPILAFLATKAATASSIAGWSASSPPANAAPVKPVVFISFPDVLGGWQKMIIKFIY